MLIGILGVVFLCVIFLVYALWPQKEMDIEDIKKLYGQYGERKGFLLFLSPVLKKLGGVNSRWKGRPVELYRGVLKRKILSAGNPAGLSADETIGLGEVLAVVFFLSTLVISAFLLEQAFSSALCYAFLFSFLGFFYPSLSLDGAVARRHKNIQRALPYSLDLLTMAVEAGLDFGAGVGKVVEKGKPSALNEELFLLLQEIRMGKSRQDALRDLGTRVNLPELTSIVSSFIQADQLGTSLGKILRVQSEQMRTRRYQLAEKLALEAPIRMLLPLLGCIFPAVFVVLFAPIIFQFMQGGF